MNIAILVLLLLFSAFFSGSETAFFSIGKVRFKQIESIQSPSARRVISLLSDPHKLIITILIGNTLVNIAASSMMADIFYDHLGEKGIGISIIAMVALLLVWGEVTPKMFALSNAQKFSFFAGAPLFFFVRLFAPLRYILNNTAGIVVRSVGLRIPSERPGITEQEIRHLFSIGRKKGVVKEKEEDMIESVLRFKDLNAADIMTPRIDVAALDLTETRDEIITKIKAEKCSRLPVYIHTLDNIVGVIHAKDFLLNPEGPIRSLVKKPCFVPESMRIDDLLNELQGKKVHMAIVTDEYGVTSGVVTMEDILEEIVGEISDELDLEIPKVRKIDQKTFEVSGQTHINEINEELGAGIETEEVDTIGGFVILQMGKIPRAGDSIESHGYRITVGDVSKNRITSLRMEKTGS
ncbi:MAG: HlyC/CorC family transporter [Candidatus Omnitrophica bacterium]|nr:HlyC/CorC family transporter [Candidatus Omnitrophota bacterium]